MLRSTQTPSTLGSSAFSISVRERASWARWLAPMLLAGALLAAPSVTWAQDLSGVTDRLNRLERTLIDLQRTVYNGAPPPDTTGGTVPEQPAPTALARIEVRLQALETQIRTLTGRVEELGYRMDQTEKRLDLLQSDTDLRLRDLEGTSGATPGDASQSGAAPATQSGRDSASGGGSTLGRPGRVLGTLPASELEAAGNQAANAPATGPAVAADSAEQLYNAAFDRLARKDFAGAEQAFKQFLENYPEDRLAGNAQYWLGETYYVRERYEDAAVAFVKGYQTYPDSPKAPDNLLKLGVALSRLGKTQDACVTLAKVETDYPNAAPQLKRRLFIEKQRLQCS